MFRSIKSLFLIVFLSIPIVLLWGQNSKNPCQTAGHNTVKPFLGEWEEYSIKNGNEVFIGRLSTRLSTEDCVLTQTFATHDSAFSYRSHGFVNPSSGIWEETYVFNSGRFAKYLWIADGEILYTLRVESSRLADQLHRLLYIDIKTDEYLVIQQGSTNGGRNWVSKDSTRIRRTKQ